MPNDFKLEAGHRFAIDSGPIRQCGLGGTGHCRVLAFDEGTMLRIAWTAAHESMSGLDSAVTFTVAPEGAGTRLLIEHDGLHPCPYVITSIGCGPGGGHTSTGASARCPQRPAPGALPSDASRRRFPAMPPNEKAEVSPRQRQASRLGGTARVLFNPPASFKFNVMVQ